MTSAAQAYQSTDHSNGTPALRLSYPTETVQFQKLKRTFAVHSEIVDAA